MKRIFAVALLLLILPLQVEAMMRPVFGPKAITNRTSAGTRYFMFEGGSLAEPNNVQQPISIDGTVANLRAQVSVAPGVGNSHTFALYVDNVASALTCAIADTDTSCTDLVNTVAVTAGQTVTWGDVTAGTPAASATTISATVEGDVAGEASMSGGSTVAVGSDLYFALSGGPSNATEVNVSYRAPMAFTLDKLYITSSAAPSAGNSFAITVMKNGSATTLTATIADAATSASDLTNTVSFAAGDTVSIFFDVTGTPTNRFQRWGVRLTPAVDGEYPIMASTAGAIATTLVRFASLYNTGAGFSGESSGTRIAPVDFELRDLYTYITAAPGSGKTWTIDSRIDSVNGNLQAVIADTSETDEDLINSDSITGGQAFNIQTTPASTPAAVTLSKFSAVAFIDPGGAPAAASGDPGIVWFFDE